MRYLSRYKNEETGEWSFKRLIVKPVDGGFRVFYQCDYGNGAGIAECPFTGIPKRYKTERGADNAITRYTPPRYQMSLYEGLVLEGKI